MKEISTEALDKKIKLIEQNNFYKEGLSKINKVLEEAKNKREDLTYWVDYVFEVGTDHLVSKQFSQMRVDQFFDLDIHLAFFLVISLVLYFLYKILSMVVRVCCCKTDKKERNSKLKR